MNDQLLMDNYLLILKSTNEVYVHGTLESSNSDIRQMLKNGLDKILESQANTYDLMTKYGWYNVQNVPGTTINQTLSNIKSKN